MVSAWKIFVNQDGITDLFDWKQLSNNKFEGDPRHPHCVKVILLNFSQIILLINVCPQTPRTFSLPHYFIRSLLITSTLKKIIVFIVPLSPKFLDSRHLCESRQNTGHKPRMPVEFKECMSLSTFLFWIKGKLRDDPRR